MGLLDLKSYNVKTCPAKTQQASIILEANPPKEVYLGSLLGKFLMVGKASLLKRGKVEE